MTWHMGWYFELAWHVFFRRISNWLVSIVSTPCYGLTMTCTPILTYMCIYSDTCALIHIRTCTCVRMYTHTCAYIYIYTPIDFHMLHVCVHMCTTRALTWTAHRLSSWRATRHSCCLRSTSTYLMTKSPQSYPLLCWGGWPTKALSINFTLDSTATSLLPACSWKLPFFSHQRCPK